MKTTSGKSGSEWKGGFLFLGNQLALDFLNTCPAQDGVAVELLPDFAALVRWHEAAGLLTCRNAAVMRQRWAETSRARRTLEAVLDLRERLRREVIAWESGAEVRGSMIDELNRLMEEHPALTKIRASGDTLARDLWFRTEEPEDLLGPIVYNKTTLFTEVHRERVRKCGQCVLHFYDTSKKGTRRWAPAPRRY